MFVSAGAAIALRSVFFLQSDSHQEFLVQLCRRRALPCEQVMAPPASGLWRVCGACCQLDNSRGVAGSESHAG
jgi:hypothetical protein